MSDIRIVWRSLLRSPLFSTIAIATLALGISASTAMFSVVDAVLLRPLPFHEPDRLVELSESNPSEGAEAAGVSVPNFSDWKARARSFDDLTLMVIDGVPSVVTIGTASMQARVAHVTPNFLDVLGVAPALGRCVRVTPGSAEAGATTEVLLSHRLWHRAFGGDPDVVGRQIRIEGGAPSVVVGVMPPTFSFPQDPDFWLPYDVDSVDIAREARFAHVIGRLRSTASLDAAQGEMRSIAATLAREHPGTNRGWTVRVDPLRDIDANTHRMSIVVLFVATMFVVLIGCANLSNLLLARGVSRQAELAVRTALGASRLQLARLLLIEGALLSAAGGATALALLWLMMPILTRLGSSFTPHIADAHVSIAVLGFCAAVSTMTAFISALLPAVRLSRVDLQVTMNPDGNRHGERTSNRRVQRLVLTAQLAVCLVLVVGAVLFIRTLTHLHRVDLGFNPAQIIAIDARFPMYRTTGRNRWQLLARDTTAALEELRTIPGIESVSAINHAPLSRTLVPVRLMLSGDLIPRRALYRNIAPGYFRTLGIPFTAGRDFTPSDISDLARLPDPDATRRSQGVVIVNETTAREFWPGENALGKMLSTEYDAGISGRRVVGIVKDSRSGSIFDAAPTEIYVPYLEDPSFAMTLLVRTRLPVDHVSNLMRSRLVNVAPDLSTANIRPLQEVVEESMGSAPFSTVLVSAFAAVSLALSALGVYGVFAFAVAIRTREIGIRSALGATRGDVARLFLREAAAPIATGVIAGSLIAMALTRLVRSLLFGVSPTDPVSFAAAIGVLVCVALAASYVPLRRAHAIDPAVALRTL